MYNDHSHYQKKILSKYALAVMVFFCNACNSHTPQSDKESIMLFTFTYVISYKLQQDKNCE